MDKKQSTQGTKRWRRRVDINRRWWGWFVTTTIRNQAVSSTTINIRRKKEEMNKTIITNYPYHHWDEKSIWVVVNGNESELIINIPRPLSSTIFKSKSRLPLIFFRSNISRFKSSTRMPLPTKGIFSGWVPWCIRKLTDDSISYCTSGTAQTELVPRLFLNLCRGSRYLARARSSFFLLIVHVLIYFFRFVVSYVQILLDWNSLFRTTQIDKQYLQHHRFCGQARQKHER